ncbi:glycosyltransferase family 4 protein [Sinanaerobacter chloroacetimidivorans]|jgi:UDP-GlcNAc:undecaprenyl-phosphate GlcNAc-1-phosphate transferase|uniref:Undecaprenyl/decaprenyl-phosphate alpha-N-acetylglucosaminyl 1-phosphate transferase n=1 Tax=Sinanaerobacter chloroacetimidivorans TaxID=2818044 RepID=A0A8J7W6V5_9FIRM|nr:MraY family glycosyltransferase [Sinanaerobacter chloroacetimidivorans]MBR0600418.1 undecaprenyl/decaprenyl-phosphate alpha-N-acetylglucosaminyl 1-phosphate transferase [Sinanaerobacter chloroacetimidivorans]
MNQLVLIFLTAFVLALLFTPVAIKIAPKIGAIDIPKDNRRMHTKAMPRFGGMAIYIGTISAMLIFLPLDTKLMGVIAGGTLIFIVGIIDDLKGMPAKVKLLMQIICACILFQFSVRISFINNPFGEGYYFFPWIVSLLVTVIWIVGITNTINLIDGLDGLAAGVAFIASISIAYTAFIHGKTEVSMAMLAIAGGALGFLPFNFNPAKIFMGDAGSLFLGFMLAGLSVISPMKSATMVATVVPVLVLAIPIFDTAFAILRRLINKRPIMEADKGHLHHRIMAVGLGQRRTVLMLYGISGVMGVAAILMSRDLLIESSLLVLIAATFIYVFLTDQNSTRLQLKAVNIKVEEKKSQRRTARKAGTAVIKKAEKKIEEKSEGQELA